MKRLVIDVRPGDYSVVRLPAGSQVPAEMFASAGTDLVSVTSATGEVSVICPTYLVPAGDQVSHGWRLLTVRGPLEFTLTGIMASVSGVLAAAGVSLLALATFDTDHVLVREAELSRGMAALVQAGHEVYEPAT